MNNEITNEYEPPIPIGDQLWMPKNLNVDTFSNGEPIPEAKTKEECDLAIKNKQPAWCYYDNNPENGEKYGKLYNWYAVNDPRGLAPDTWHVPNYSEWQKLINFLVHSFAGFKLKSNKGWLDNGGGNNYFNFSALPGGFFVNEKGFCNIEKTAGWWSLIIDVVENQSIYYVDYDKNIIDRYNYNEHEATYLSVRCIKDENSKQ